MSFSSCDLLVGDIELEYVQTFCVTDLSLSVLFLFPSMWLFFSFSFLFSFFFIPFTFAYFIFFSLYFSMINQFKSVCSITIFHND